MGQEIFFLRFFLGHVNLQTFMCFSALDVDYFKIDWWNVQCHSIMGWYSQTSNGSTCTGSLWSRFAGCCCRISVSDNVDWRGTGRRVPWKPLTPPPFIQAAPCGFSSPRPSAGWLNEEGEAGQFLIRGLPSELLSLVSKRSLFPRWGRPEGSDWEISSP